MIDKETMESIAKLFFEGNYSPFRIAYFSDNLTIGNVTHCIKEMEYKYYPIIIEKDMTKGTSKNNRNIRNEEMGRLYEAGYSMRSIAKRYNLSHGRTAQIIYKLARQKIIRVEVERDSYGENRPIPVIPLTIRKVSDIIRDERIIEKARFL